MAEENAPRERFGYDRNEDGRISLGERVRDMLDGGGRGQSGPRFEGGGLLSDIGNALGGPGGFNRGNDNGGGFISPGGLLGGALGGAFFGPFGGLLGSIIGRRMGQDQQGMPMADGNAPSLMAAPAAPAMAPAMAAAMQPAPNAMMGAPTMGMPSMGAMPTMPMPEMYAPRGYAGRSRTMPMQGFAPVMDVRPPPPAPAGMNLPVNPGAAEANRAYIEMLRRAAARGNPIRPAASMLPR